MVTQDVGPEGFVLAEDPLIYRPGSGVTSGTGTAQDPYVIEGWCLVPDEFEESGVLLQDTSAHVLIRDNLVVGPPTEYTVGVTLERAVNVRVENNTMLQGGGDGMKMISAHGVMVKGNTFSDTRMGVFMWDTKEPRFEGNEFVDAWRGMNLRDSEDVVVEGNTIQNAVNRGIIMSGVTRGTIQDNSILDGGGDARGVQLSQTSDVSVLTNEIRENGEAVRVVSSSGAAVHHNNFMESEHYGLHAFSSTVDARFNWWGCPDGPTDPDCDGVAGSGTVDYSDWLTSPNPLAGA